MSYRKFRKELNKKREEQNVMNALKSMLSKLESKRDEYAEKAKAELKKGNKAQYSAYVALLKNAMFNIAQTRDMIANFTIAIDLREMQTLSSKFVKALNSVMKDVYKTSKSIRIASSQKLFNKALDKQHYSAFELQELLKENNVAFESSVNGLSDISDEEVRSVLEAEIKKDEKDIDEMLSKLEAEFAVAKPTRMVAEVQGDMPQLQVNPNNSRGTDKAETAKPAASTKPDDLTNVPASDKDGGAQNGDAIVGQGDVGGADNGRQGGSDSGEQGRLSDNKIEVSGAAYRPQYLKDYVGQPNAVATISPHIKTSLLRATALPHVLLCGSYGQGKTTLANIIAREMGANFINVNPGIKERDLIRILRGVKKGDIVFIDEVHQLSSDIIENVLYPAMEDYELHITESNSTRTNSKVEKIQPFTLIGATTETGKLLKPFYSKFPINITLAEYKEETIAAIIKNSFAVNKMRISDELCYEIARRSRLSPRTANAFVVGIGNSAIVREAEKQGISADGALCDASRLAALKIEITRDDVENYFKTLGIDKLGLKEEERKILHYLIEHYNGGPVGQENIAKGLNVAVNRIDQEYEPYLIKLGFIGVGVQGRFVTTSGYKYLGINKPDKRGSEKGKKAGAKPVSTDKPAGNSSEQRDQQDKENKDDELPEIECQAGQTDKAVAERFMALLSGTAEVKQSSLDELFPDVEKDYDSAASNRCILKVGERKLYCDSKLERKFLAYLFRNGCITDAKAEALELDYSSDSMSGKRYFPDFVLKLHDGTVAVIEMKNLSSMGYHLNIDKYSALEKFCRDNGYKYAEIGKDYQTNRYISAEAIKQRGVNEQLKKLVYEKIAVNGICTEDDLKEINYDVKDLVCLLLNDRDLKNIDRTGNNAKIISAKE